MSAPVALPSSPPLPAASGVAAASSVTLVLGGPAQVLAAFAAATQIGGTLAPGIDPGEMILLTALGALPVKTSTDLPAGTRLILQAIADRPGVALVVAINDMPTTQRAASPMTAAAPAPAPIPPTIVELGTTITAIVVGVAEPLPPGSPSGALPEAAPDAPAAAPTDQTAVPSSEPKAALSRPAPPELARPAPIPPELALGTRAPAVTPGTAISLRILAVQPPAPVPGSPPAPALSGVVIPSPQRSLGTPVSTLVDTSAGVLQLVTAPKSSAEPPGRPPSGAPVAATTGEPTTLRLPPGTQLSLRLLAGSPATALVTIPATDAPSPPVAAPAASVQGTEAVPPQEQSDTGAPPPAVTARATGPEAVEFRVLLAAPGPRQPITAGSPQPIIGTVLARHITSGTSPTLIATPLGMLAVAEPLSLPVGTLLLVLMQDDPLTADVPAAARPTRLDNGWSAFGAALQTLGQAAPDLAAHFRADLSPQSAERLAASFMFLVAALRGDAAHLWPGDAIEHALAAAGRGDLKLRLSEEFSEMRAIADSPATTPWQVFVLPLVDGAAVRPIRLYLKRPGERGRRTARDDNARFILEFELTRLGTMQLDGFVRERRFDLVLRSHAPLAAPLRQAVERIFYDRVAAAGLAGSLDFATAARFDVAPLDGLRERIGRAV